MPVLTRRVINIAVPRGQLPGIRESALPLSLSSLPEPEESPESEELLEAAAALHLSTLPEAVCVSALLLKSQAVLSLFCFR